MNPSIILPPSVFFSYLIPSIQSSEEAHYYKNLLISYYDFLTDMIFKFSFRNGSVTNVKYYQKLSDERTAVILYIQELQEVAKRFEN